MVSSFSNKINGVEKSKSQTNYNYCNLAELKRHTVGGQVFEQEIHYDKTRPSIIYDLKGTVPDVDVLMTTYYDYDDMGRVTEIYNGGHISYEYDSYGQIIRENNSALDKTFAYEYNDIGNIVNVKEYDYTTEDYDLTYTEKTYTYDASLPDRLTSFNGSAITYNAIGCPTSFDGYMAVWSRGKLAMLSKSGTQIRYNYNAFGQRIRKTYSGTTDYRCEFCYDESGRLVCETKYSDSGSVIDKIIYLYDVNSIIGMVHTLNGVESTYYFQRNLLGDVIGIYNTSGVKVGGYAYDAWGNHAVTLDTDGIATRNPIRYRGYYYDTETKLYYLNARYYNPEWRRFISPDDTAYLDPESVNGLNLYAYCNNDPVNYADPSGHFMISTAVLIGAIIGAVVGAGVGFGIAVYNDYKDDGEIFNGSVAWYDYLGATLLGGAIGAVVGGAIGYGVGYFAGGTYSNGLVAKSVTKGVKSFMSNSNNINHVLGNTKHNLFGYTEKSMMKLMKKTLSKGTYEAYKTVDSMVLASTNSQVTYKIIKGAIMISNMWIKMG